MELQKIEHDFTICKIDSLEDVDWTAEFVFLSKTDDEISLVCASKNLPSNTISYESGWKALKICGILDFGMIGVISKISTILADADICIFVVSTYHTDYILLKAADFDRGIQTLTHNGYVLPISPL